MHFSMWYTIKLYDVNPSAFESNFHRNFNGGSKANTHTHKNQVIQASNNKTITWIKFEFRTDVWEIEGVVFHFNCANTPGSFTSVVLFFKGPFILLLMHFKTGFRTLCEEHARTHAHTETKNGKWKWATDEWSAVFGPDASN